MISNLTSATSDLIRTVLDVSLVRHKIIANNIANQNNQEFVPQKVEFEKLLAAEFSQTGVLQNDDKVREALEFVQAGIADRQENMIAGEPEKTLDLEMSEMAENTLRYEALIRGLSKLGDIRSMAISGGRK